MRDYRSLIGEKITIVSHQAGKKLFISRSVFAEKDVNRTDRTNRFYEGIDNPGLVLLHDILMTYCMYDFDLGETPLPRGMSSARVTGWCSLPLNTCSCRLRSGHERPVVPHPLRDGERGGSFLVFCLLYGPDGEFGWGVCGTFTQPYRLVKVCVCVCTAPEL